MATTKRNKRKNVDDDDGEYPKPSKIIKKQSHIKLTYTLEILNKQQKESKECVTTKKINLISEKIEENIFKETFIDNIFNELQNGELKESFNMKNLNYYLNFITLNNGTSSFKLGEIEINPILIKTYLRFFIIQIDDKNFDKNNFFENNNNNSNIITILDENVELRNDLNFPFTQHYININWNINEEWNKEKLEKYYWGYQIIKPSFFNNSNFGIKCLEEKIIQYNDGTDNDLKTEVKNEIEKLQKNIHEQILNIFNDREMCNKLLECQKN